MGNFLLPLLYHKNKVAMDAIKIGMLIRDERLLRGMTQMELGSKIGVGKAQISKIESGSVTLKSLQKATEALELELDINLVSKKSPDKRVVGYVVACINAFAKQFNIKLTAAVNYLNRFGGIAFLINHYDAQHLLSIDDTVQDLAIVCGNNGGGVQ